MRVLVCIVALALSLVPVVICRLALAQEANTQEATQQTMQQTPPDTPVAAPVLTDGITAGVGIEVTADPDDPEPIGEGVE
jgi:hypothetical protein